MQFDTDSNGTIEFPEFCSMMAGRMLAGHDLETVRMTFRALDISGSGRISCKQFKYLITNIGNQVDISSTSSMKTENRSKYHCRRQAERAGGGGPAGRCRQEPRWRHQLPGVCQHVVWREPRADRGGGQTSADDIIPSLVSFVLDSILLLILRLG